MSFPALAVAAPRPNRAVALLRLVGAPGLIALVLLSCIAAGGLWRLTGLVVTPFDPVALDLSSRLLPPSLAHPFGTDSLGRDVLSRVVTGAWFSLMTALAVIAIAATVGTLTGAVAGLFGGLADEGLMRVTDLFLAFPALVLAAAISATFGGGLATTALALAAVFWPWYARIARARVLGLKNLDFRHGGHHAWRRPALSSVRHPAAPAGPHHAGADDDGCGLRHPVAVQPVLPWAGRPVAAARMGRHDLRGASLPAPRLVAGGFPGRGNRADRPGLHLLGDRLRDRLDPDRKARGD
jgi:hypothetical protein